jgi:periplasmic divalent cation tolerance protein
MKAILVTTTTDSKKEAVRISGKLLDARLAACVQIVSGVESRYWWQGKKETSAEWLCLIKTTEKLYPAVESTIKQIHSYEEPEITALAFVRGNAGYLGWLEKETDASRK